ncbi:hypothetical protein Fot_22458 [Forsythia ovata]|uniref:Uncharacterized protein n=1 Tax=Forsythia ovata TaxID=205694 RepID=A0ABD1UXR8_9LAMI
MHLENQILRSELAISKNARARAIYDVAKSRTIQMACAQAQRKAESQLRACQNMVHAKDKELIEALAELSKSKGLLASLGVPGYVDPKDPAGTYEPYSFITYADVVFPDFKNPC